MAKPAVTKKIIEFRTVLAENLSGTTARVGKMELTIVPRYHGKRWFKLRKTTTRSTPVRKPPEPGYELQIHE